MGGNKMKRINRVIIAALAASMALVSCVEDNLRKPEDAVIEKDGARVIAISFKQTTKTTLDGFQPKFAAGDTIKISNSVSAPENRLVKIDDHGNAYITTDLMGALKAVYPASAADLKKNEKQIDTIVGVKVPAVQSGKFADANICLAEIQDAATTANFKNEVAILKFYVDKSIGVKKITVSSENNLASGSKTITVDPEADATINEITDDPEDRICYVAVLPGEKSNLKFTSETTTQGSVERIFTADVALEKNGMYNAFIPYYIDLGKAGKWAYCNIGAFLPEESGKYFAWGDTKGQTWNGSSWSGSFQTIEGNPDTLKLENDAAHVIWDGSWRMPTKAQLDTLAASTKEWIEAKGYKLYTASADTSIFLPAAGSSADMAKVGTSGEYWSSSLNTADEKALAYKLGISNGSATTATMSRTVGANIRPFRHIPVDSIVLSKIVDTVKIGNEFVDTLIATVYPANASDTLVTWTSSNEAVATVERGIVIGKAGGTATITARIIDLNGIEKSTTCEVKVPAKVTDVTLNKTSIAALNVGSTETLTATISPSANTIIVSTTWSSDKPSIANVDNGTVTGVAPGTATIKVTVKDVYNIEKTAECSVTVLSPVAEVNGDFSVSSTLKVRFAKGNLKYDATNKRWGTYDKQYEFNNSSTYDPDHKNLITLFNWGYNAEESIKPNANSYTNVNITGEGSLSKSEDWGYVFGGDNSPWRTLTKTEWEYLINNHTVKKNVTVCGVAGCVILAPDNFSGGIAESYDATTWETAEGSGLVCLPPVGFRLTNWKDETSITLTFGSPVQRLGYYWTSSSYDGTYGFKVTISDSSGISCDQQSKDCGCAVRLVKNVE